MNSLTMKRRTKILLTSFASLILIGCLYYVSNPYAYHNRDATKTLERFYEAFVIKNYFPISQIMEPGSIQGIINERVWYGDIQSKQYLFVIPTGIDTRKVFVKVKTILGYGEETHYDTIKLKKNDIWLVESYQNTHEVRLP